MKHYLKYMPLAVFGTVLSLFWYFSTNMTIKASHIISLIAFDNFDILKVCAFDYLVVFFPLLLFQVFFGTYIYRHFCSASIYYFSRCKNRTKWFLKESGILYANTFLYIAIIILSAFGTISIRNKIAFDSITIIVLIYYILITTFYLFFTTLLINIISTKLSSATGFAIVQGVQLAFLSALCLKEGKILMDPASGHKDSKYLIFNPMAHLVMKFHSSSYGRLNSTINKYNTKFDVNISVVVFLVCSILTVIIGCIVVNRHNFIASDIESEGL